MTQSPPFSEAVPTARKPGVDSETRNLLRGNVIELQFDPRKTPVASKHLPRRVLPPNACISALIDGGSRALLSADPIRRKPFETPVLRRPTLAGPRPQTQSGESRLRREHDCDAHAAGVGPQTQSGESRLRPPGARLREVGEPPGPQTQSGESRLRHVRN